MGGSGSKYESSSVCEEDVRKLKEKVRLLQGQVKEILCEKENESRAYERDLMVYAFKEAERKQERKKLKEEVKMLKMAVEDKEEKIREMKMQKEAAGGGLVGHNMKNTSDDGKEWESLGIKLLMEHMKEESVQRDAAVEKWKQLYLEIKTELDELIQRTYYHGEELCWRAEEGIHAEKLKEEVEDKKETINALKAQLASMQHDKYRKERELDLLRQSSRIMSTNKNKKSLHGKNKCFKSLKL